MLEPLEISEMRYSTCNEIMIEINSQGCEEKFWLGGEWLKI